jgi:hypothetical protein
MDSSKTAKVCIPSGPVIGNLPAGRRPVFREIEGVGIEGAATPTDLRLHLYTK